MLLLGAIGFSEHVFKAAMETTYVSYVSIVSQEVTIVRSLNCLSPGGAQAHSRKASYLLFFDVPERMTSQGGEHDLVLHLLVGAEDSRTSLVDFQQRSPLT